MRIPRLRDPTRHKTVRKKKSRRFGRDDKPPCWLAELKPGTYNDKTMRLQKRQEIIRF